MINIKNNRTGFIYDPWEHLGPKRRKLLDNSWAGLFRTVIYPVLPVEQMAPFFSSNFGRPSKEMYTVQGVLILQQMLDLSDAETVQQLAFNEQWRYALNITSDSDKAIYMCPKTLWNMRKIVTDNELDTVLFQNITDHLAKVFAVDTSKQRLDSVHIKSNMKHLGRIGIFVKTIQKFLVDLKRQHLEAFATIDPAVVERYYRDKAVQCFSMVKPSESERTLASVSRDLFQLAQLFAEHPEVPQLSSYQLLQRVLQEHCKIIPGPDGQPVEVIPQAARDIPADSLQNPSDPDAAYDGHKGQGYQVQVMETYVVPQAETEAKDKDTDSDRDTAPAEDPPAPVLRLITHVEVQPAHESDAHALLPALEATQKRGLGPAEVLADTLYGSDDNCQAAATLGVEVVAPVSGPPPVGKLSLADFTFAADETILTCPQGQTPVKTNGTAKGFGAAFDSETCRNCPWQADCPVKPGKTRHYLHYDAKRLRLARRRAHEPTPAFQERYRYRAGIEGAISTYDRRTGVKRLRVRGLKAVRFCATLKAIGVNIYRATAVRKAQPGQNCAARGLTCQFVALAAMVKELFRAIRDRFWNIFAPEAYFHHSDLQMAA